jgi:C-8 sterol isomerase
MGYVFDPARLHEIARAHVNLPTEAMLAAITDDLVRAYPGHVHPAPRWVFNLAGGYVGVMTIMHASLSEYILLFGAPIGATGFSGRYLMDVYDYLLTGELRGFTEESFHEPAITQPGELALLRRGTAKGFTLTAGSWVLEYGRGVIPASLPFALSYALFACFEPVTVVKTIWLYSWLVLKELWNGKI